MVVKDFSWCREPEEFIFHCRSRKVRYSLLGKSKVRLETMEQGIGWFFRLFCVFIFKLSTLKKNEENSTYSTPTLKVNFLKVIAYF